MAWLRSKLQGLQVWLNFGILLLLMAFVLMLLASGRVPGIPDAPLKPVTLYSSPQGANAAVSVYLQPPASTLQAGGEGQLLALQFSNRSETPVTLEPTIVEPRNCFELRALNASPAQLGAGQTLVVLYRLTATLRPNEAGIKPVCDGQVPANFRYGFAKDANLTPGVAAPSSSGEGFISTSPITITTPRIVRMERFFRIAAALTIPLLVALSSFWFQRFQIRRAELQKEQELRLEVWKMVFPIVNGQNDKHYIQMIRKMDVARVEIETARKSPNGPRLAASLLIVQSAYAALYELVGGFNFRNMPAEDLCATVSIAMREQLETMAGGPDKLEQLRGKVPMQDPGKDTLPGAISKLNAFALADPQFQATLKTFQDAVGQPEPMRVLDNRLLFVRQLLAFENNILWYPEWYRTAPIMMIDETWLDSMDMPDLKEYMVERFVQYRKVVPEACWKDTHLPGHKGGSGAAGVVARLLGAVRHTKAAPQPPAPAAGSNSKTP